MRKMEDKNKKTSILSDREKADLILLLKIDIQKAVFKWVRKDHVQTTEHWTKHWKWAKIGNYYGKL